ncbi:MAG: patatin-like phospholipase family protein [Candidatus Korobacteraceae bacterium]
MPEGPVKLHEVLCQEYQTLRPGVDFSGENSSEVREKLRRQEKPLSALCISGGGIRSATFALGALQALADHGLLDQFDYLSTVSGGGYIGSWLTAWIKRAGGIEKVIPQLRSKAEQVPGSGVDPIQHLREYNNYLSPQLGFFSADTWTLGATVVRNILLNWLVLVPLLMLVLMVPRLVLAVFRLGETYREMGLGAAIASSWVERRGLPLFFAFLLAFAIFNIARYLPSAGGRDHSQNDFLLKVLAPLAGAILSFMVYDSLLFGASEHNLTLERGAIFWVLLPCAAGWLVFLLCCVRSLKRRLQLLFGPLSLALILVATCMDAMAWVLTNIVLPGWAFYVTIVPPLLLLAFDFGGTLFVGLSSTVLEDDDREWMARASAWNQMLSFSWLVACALVLLAPGWAFHWKTWGKELLAVIGVASAWLSRLSGAVAPSGGKHPGPSRKVFAYVVKLAPAMFLVTFCVGLSIFTNWLLYSTGLLLPPVPGEVASWTNHRFLLEHTPWFLALGGLVALLVLSQVTARYININRFSLHAMYRNRLIRAYLGASNPKRNAARFTGFAPEDNLLMRDLRTGFRPFHVVNVALNLVSGERLAWQQRKAQSFTLSPLHSGNYELGYRDSAEYGGRDGITLGTAVTISGAAASPSMGYHSSPVKGFVMTLLNARLGAWLGNPGDAGERTWRQDGPRSAVGSLVREALGLTDNASAYVYLSDGGHFENLALYEMILRRCRQIVVLDSGCDPAFTYEDLGNALRKVRIDLKVPVDFEDQYIHPMREKKRRCAIATIRYSAVDATWPDGQLIYIKPMLLGTEPPDVEAYAAANPSFPHQSTGNQWFNESQTESYRMLGLHTLDEICRSWNGNSLEDFGQHVREMYLTLSPDTPQTRRPATAAAVAGT